MLKTLPFVKKIIEKKRQLTMEKCLDVISKNKADYQYGYSDLNFNRPRIKDNDSWYFLLLITEITSDYLTIKHVPERYAGTDYDTLIEILKEKETLTLKIEKDDPLYDKIKKDLEEDKKRIKKIIFNNRLSEVESLKDELRKIQYKINETNERLQKKRQTLNELHDANSINIAVIEPPPLFEEDEIKELEQKKAKLNEKITSLTDSLKHFDFSGSIYT